MAPFTSVEGFFTRRGGGGVILCLCDQRLLVMIDPALFPLVTWSPCLSWNKRTPPKIWHPDGATSNLKSDPFLQPDPIPFSSTSIIRWSLRSSVNQRSFTSWVSVTNRWKSSSFIHPIIYYHFYLLTVRHQLAIQQQLQCRIIDWSQLLADYFWSVCSFRRKGQRNNMSIYHIIISVMLIVKLFADCNRRDTLALFLDRHWLSRNDLIRVKSRNVQIKRE